MEWRSYLAASCRFFPACCSRRGNCVCSNADIFAVDATPCELSSARWSNLDLDTLLEQLEHFLSVTSQIRRYWIYWLLKSSDQGWRPGAPNLSAAGVGLLLWIDFSVCFRFLIKVIASHTHIQKMAFLCSWDMQKLLFGRLVVITGEFFKAGGVENT